MESPLQLYCFHIMATLPEDYDKGKIPGYVDCVDGLSFSCGLSASKVKKRKSKGKKDEEASTSKNARIDFYFKKRDSAEEVETIRDEPDSSMVQTPWKMSVLHTGTKNVHWHFIYISSHPCFKTNSKLGRDIVEVRNKYKKIQCVPCLYNYLRSGNGRQVITDNMDEPSKYLLLCEGHKAEVEDSLVHQNFEEDCDNDNLFIRSVVCNQPSSAIYFSNNDLLDMFLNERAFNDSSARLVLSRSDQGRHFLFRPKVSDIIKTAVHTCKLLTFQETALQRLERAKRFYLRTKQDLSFENHVSNLKQWLSANGIDAAYFAEITFNHFKMMCGKKNNLFFCGPPSTGKSMVMESLVACHYNYTRLTGLVDSSPFNFASLIHSNACFMDEIKLTESHFEQWKLIAAGLPCSTDIKYQDKGDITNCVLYTCSNYEIASHCKVVDCENAIEERTFTFRITAPCKHYFYVSPQAWEMFWNEMSK